MKIICLHQSCPEEAYGSTLIIGKFDAIHRGHQHLVNLAKSIGDKVSLLTFEPNPVLFFHPELRDNQILSFREKIMHLDKKGVEYVFIQKFDQEFSKLTAEEFVEDILIKKLKIANLIVGEDFAFGFKRGGDVHFLAKYQSYFNLHVAGLQKFSGMQCSTSAIRNYIKNGDLDKASKLLGYRYYIAGKVIHGSKRGRQLGFPTANVKLANILHPNFGVYLVKVYIDGNTQKMYYGIANLGLKPTFNDTVPMLEVNIFDFAQDIYGKRLKVELLQFIRPQHKFNSVNELISQIGQDVKNAKIILSNDFGYYSS